MFLLQNMLLRDILDLFNLALFNPINQMILLTVIPQSGAHCSNPMITLTKYNLRMFDCKEALLDLGNLKIINYTL
jgi:hypothetical protein